MSVPRKLTGNFVETEVDGEVLLVDLDGGELLSMEGTARAIWRLIDGERDREEILAALIEKYGRDAAIVADLDEFLGELEQARLIGSE